MYRSRMRKSGPVDRRTWMEWMGQATVLSLGSLVLGCGSDTDASAAGSGGSAGTAGSAGSAGSAGMGGSDAGPAIDAAPGPSCDGGPPLEFPFQPSANEGGVFDAWPVRTVDTQTLEDILATWKLSIEGMVKTPIVLTFADLLCLLRQDQITDHHCVEGWSIHDIPWNGVHLSTLFALAEPFAAATHVTFHTIDDRYNESLPIDIALEPKTLLAYGVDGNTLPMQRGFPARLVVPRLFGYKGAKYVERIELTDHPIDGYWVAAGYGYDAEVQPERLRPGKY